MDKTRGDRSIHTNPLFHNATPLLLSVYAPYRLPHITGWRIVPRSSETPGGLGTLAADAHLDSYEIEPRFRLVTIFNADFRSRATLAVTKNILWSRSNEWVIGVGNGVASCSLMLFVNGPSIRE